MSPRENQIRNELLEDVPGYDYAVQVVANRDVARITALSQGRLVVSVSLEDLRYSDREGRADCVRQALGKRVLGSA